MEKTALLSEAVLTDGYLTKDTINMVAEQVSRQVDDGYINPLDAFLRVKILEATVEALKKVLQDKATDEALKFGNGEHTVNGIKIKVGETGTRYKFDHIPAWVAACHVRDEETKGYNETIKQIEEAAKARIINPLLIAVDENTGEEIEAAIKESRTSVIVTIPKK